MKHENKIKRRVKSVLPALEERFFAKRMEENDKNSNRWLDRLVRVKKVFEKFLKSDESREKILFKKHSARFSIDRKLHSIGRKSFDWSNTNRGPIETHRDFFGFFKTISTDRKTDSINRNSGKIELSKNETILVQNSSKH